jgi:GNAT superfamily N-acetyltransferase
VLKYPRSGGPQDDEWETVTVIHTLKLPVALSAKTQEYTLRRATDSDLRALMLLLADDPISATRGDKADDSESPAYRTALTAIVTDPSNDLLVVVNESDEPLATMQLTRIPGMARRGSTRLLIEAVRVRSDYRSSGIGSAMMRWVTGIAAPAIEASLVQLTSDEARQDAHRFYKRLGFVGSHRGFKYKVG